MIFIKNLKNIFCFKLNLLESPSPAKLDSLTNFIEARNKLKDEIMQKMSYYNFMKNSKEVRFKLITEWNKNYKNIKIWDTVQFNFIFDGKTNKEIYRKTTAWDAIPDEVKVVESDWIKYFRDYKTWEFFPENSNKRLIIKTWTRIKILKKEEINFVTIKKTSYTKDKLKAWFPKISDFEFLSLDDFDKWLLDIIWEWESGGNYNALWPDKNQDKIKFTDMTIKEVLAFQKKYTDWWKKSSAVWKYQFIRKTLKRLCEKYSISLNENFSPEIQDKLALSYLEELWLEKFKKWKISASKLQNRISGVWAVIQKTDGKWTYDDDWINKSNNRITEILSKYLKKFKIS